MEIRKIRPEEHREVENVIREAFWNVYGPGCEEPYMVHLMRGVEEYVPELELVALDGGKIVGAVIQLRSFILGDDGGRHEVLSLGPIGVLPQYQGKKVGAALVEASKNRARELGFRAILLCGAHGFYGKCGFEMAENFGIRDAENDYVDPLHICVLHDRAAEGLAGRYFENPVYQVDQEAAEAFDRDFPPKVKEIGTKSQLEFQEALKMRRPGPRLSV